MQFDEILTIASALVGLVSALVGLAASVIELITALSESNRNEEDR